jgi:hypothetical protein
MPAEGLQAVLKDVERAGASFQQRYWVKVDEVKALVKSEGWNGAMTKMGGSLPDAMHMMSAWTGSSSSPGGLKLQGAAAAVMGGNLADWPNGTIPSHVVGMKAGFDDPTAQKTVVALQAVTRAGLENKGYKPRTMYRGMGGTIAAQMLQAAKDQADKGIPYHEAAMTINLNPGSSFSETEITATGFGSAVVAIHEVPADAYIAHYKVQGAGNVGIKHGSTNEKEGILAFKGPHTINVQDVRGTHAEKIISYFKEKGLYDPSKMALDDHPPSTISNARLGITTPKELKTIKVPLFVKIPSGMTKEMVHEHLKASGAAIVSSQGDAVGVTVPSHKIESFTDSFAKTGSFDSKLHQPESLKKYMKAKATSIAVADNFDADFGKAGEPSKAAPAAPKVPKIKAAPKFLETLSDLPETGPVLHSSGEVGALANKETGWRGLWVKWAKQAATAQGHEGKQALVKAIHAINAENPKFKEFIKMQSPTKPAFKAFLKAQVEKHVKK